MSTSVKKAIIIGAGPAGLTAAYELLEKGIRPVIFEQTSDIGGISKTINYKGNRIDIGGHRFFSKSGRVVDWWLKIMPLQGAPARDERLLGKEFSLEEVERVMGQDGAHPSSQKLPDPEKTDRVMLVRGRLSRILFLRKFFDYPISMNMETLAKLGAFRLAKILMSYLRARAFPLKESSLEDFFVNRFGRELYATFFRDYTEKVWGVPCTAISPSWGAQRIKGLSITKAIAHAAKKAVSKDRSLAQKGTETSLIERFMYPKLGPGQMWEEVARLVVERGGEICMNSEVTGLELAGDRVIGAVVRDSGTGQTSTHRGDWFLSTMPVRDLVQALGDNVPKDVRRIADGLVYRDFMTVGMLLKRLKIKNETKIKTVNGVIPDNWIYVQESDVKLGRIQVFNNWSPYLVKDPDTVWIGLEYFCNEGDPLWSMTDKALADFASGELEKIGVARKEEVMDATVIRMPKCYPCYFGSYGSFEVVRKYVDGIENLFLIGRNGMHRYNNQDHSMLTAMAAAGNISKGITSKDNVWSVNAEDEYHESK